MKLKILFTLTLLVTLVAGCTAVTDSDNGDGLSTDRTLAYSTYMAGAFLSNPIEGDTTSSNSVMTLDHHSEEDAMLNIEEHLGEVSEYFNRLRVFLDNGMENPFTVEQDFDVEGDYDITMRYTVEDMTYTILLNEDEEGNLEGTLILDGVEYDVEGTREVDTDYEDDDENIVEEHEEEIYLKTLAKEGSEDYVEISIETEDEHDEYEFEMELTSYINGVLTELEIEFEVEEDEVSIEITTQGGNTYEFTRESDNDGNEIEYEFEYEIDGVEGEVELTIIIDEDGNKVYYYSIEEDGVQKDFEQPEDDDYDDFEDDEDEDDEDDL